MIELPKLLRAHSGALTETLEQSPAGHGLGRLPLPMHPEATATSVCGFCSTGCGLRVHLREGAAVGLTPATRYPVNLGMACPKGWEALSALNSADRATTPMLRGKAGRLGPVDWETAMRTFVERFKGIQERYGADSVAWLGTGQIVSEELAFLGALAKFGMGIRHGDGNTRQCMATAVTAYKQSFGFDAPPYTYADLEESDVIVLIGSNMCIAHPILWERVCRNRHKPRIIVIDPRLTETARAATEHVAVRPKGDLPLLYALAHTLVRNGWIDREFIDHSTSGFEEFARHVGGYAPEAVFDRTGVAAARVEELARWIHEGRRVSFWWTMGVNQSYEGTRVAQAIINLALMTGNIGRPGTGANSITGQCNAMGSRLFSNTTNLLGGHEFTKFEHRAKVASLLGIEAGRIPETNSWSYDRIVEGIVDGRIKGLWIIGTNPFHSWIGQNDFRRMLRRLDFLVVQDMYQNTETAQTADLVLPAAGWGEKEGTFINSERRIGLVRKVARAPGQALADFSIFKLLAHYWGCGEMFREWESPEAVFQILKRLTRGQPCDITGISDYAMLDALGGVQWPCPEGHSVDKCATERRLFGDGRFYHEDGKARFIFDHSKPMPEQPTAAYPFVLLTGRGSAAQWHTQTRTRNSAVLRKLYPRQLYVEIHPEDAGRLAIGPDQWVLIESQRGRVRARAFVTTCIRPGQVFLPMHYASTNQLTDPVFDPHSRQPSYKACAVRVEALPKGGGGE